MILVLDGVPGSLFNHLYDGGKLPNFRQAFAGGLRVQHLVSAFPTDTVTCYPLIAWGLRVPELPEISQTWYDRRSEKYIYVWDPFPFLRPKPSITGYATPFDGKGTLAIGFQGVQQAGLRIPPFYVIFGVYLSSLGRWSDALILRSLPRWLQRFDTILFWNSSADHMAHQAGRVGLEEALCNYDRHFGVAMEQIKQPLNLFLFSDHGNAPTKGIFPLQQALRERGYRLVRRRREPKDIVLCSTLLNYALIYTSQAGQVAEALCQYPEVSLCAYRNQKNDSIALRDADGEAIVRRQDDDRYMYIPRTSDPLGYAPILRGSDDCLPAREWLRRTLDTRYPYGLIRLHEVLANPQCGELVASFDEGYCPPWSLALGGRGKLDINWPPYQYNHGGLNREELLSFFLASGPDIPVQLCQAALLEDLYGLFQCYKLEGRVSALPA